MIRSSVAPYAFPARLMASTSLAAVGPHKSIPQNKPLVKHLSPLPPVTLRHHSSPPPRTIQANIRVTPASIGTDLAKFAGPLPSTRSPDRPSVGSGAMRCGYGTATPHHAAPRVGAPSEIPPRRANEWSEPLTRASSRQL